MKCKSVLFIILVLTMLLCGSAQAAEAETLYVVDRADAFVFDEYSGTILGFTKPTESFYAVAIPDEINGVAVEAIASYVFEDCVGLKRVTLPEAVTTIQYGLFKGCTNLEAINTEHVETIKQRAFYGCSALRTLPLDSCEDIESYAFFRAGLVAVELPETVTYIDQYAFQECVDLVSVTAEYLRYIDMGAFYDCTSLKETPDLSNVYNIQGYAFHGCTSLTKVDLYALEHNLTLGDGILDGCTALEKITLHCCEAYSMGTYNATAYTQYGPFRGIPSDVQLVFDGAPTKIGDGLFRRSTILTNLDSIPESVTEYGWFAFAQSGLTEVTVPAHITTVGPGCFSTCSELASVTILNDASAWDLTDQVFDRSINEAGSQYGNTQLYGFFCKVDFSEAGERANITIAEGWTEVPHGFFAGSYLKDTYFLEDMEELVRISPYAFYRCDLLVDLYIPDGVETISYHAFHRSFQHVYSFTIPASVTKLESYKDIEPNGGAIQQQFFGWGANHSSSLPDDVLSEVYILNPELELYADQLGKDYTYYVFNYNFYSVGKPLTIYGYKGSTAEALCNASDGRFVFVPIIQKTAALGHAELTHACVRAEGNGVTVEGLLRNDTDRELTGTVWTVVYDTNGRMLALEKQQEQTLKPGSAVPVEADMTMELPDSGELAIRLLWLGLTTMEPLSTTEGVSLPIP